MKKLFWKTENLLLIVPLLVCLFQYFFYPDSALDIHFHDTYFVVANSMIATAAFSFMCCLYMLHLVLRTINKRPAFFCDLHVFGSVFLYLLLFFVSVNYSDSAHLLSTRRYYDFSAWEQFSGYTNNDKAMVIVLVLFVLLQGWFAYYFIRAIFKKAA